MGSAGAPHPDCAVSLMCFTPGKSRTLQRGAWCSSWEDKEDLAGEGNLPSAKCPNEEKGAPGMEKNQDRSSEVT